ncbi:helix-turn-helix transcriptional regulator [Bacillus sp. SRB1LM]|uniref:helix-turn-helix transcriptional regulator n=1 Tax=Bacillus sp. SRB1LM TaxID=2608688 RepID=UPI0018C3A691|nr:helix-turn-helix transcriptional regulator [Bacillus sp. SRB1LM]MBG0962482.1 helix-turn-helix transcriptional regulator [Bacillus sp. SRB1LM]
MKRYWLVKIREDLGLIQDKAAKMANISRTHYADIETGRRTPSPRLALRIAMVLNFPFEWFFMPSYLHNAEKEVIEAALQLDFPEKDIFLNEFPHFAEKIKE